MTGLDIVFVGLLIIVLGAMGYLWYRHNQLQRKIKAIFQSETIENVDEMLASYEKRFQSIEKHITRIFTKQQDDAIMLNNSIHKVSLKKFNPFADMGGDRSFVLALLNAEHTGFLVTYIAMRDGGRTYIKAVTKGKSSQTLSQEELDAIQEAISQ